jgi:hypothetical protein
MRRRKTMTILSQTLRTKCRKALLAAVALLVLLPPAGVLAAEREGTVLFFSLEDLQQALSRPSPFSLSPFMQLSPSFARREQSEAEKQDGPVERNSCWGDGLGVDGYTCSGIRPLWDH